MRAGACRAGKQYGTLHIPGDTWVEVNYWQPGGRRPPNLFGRCRATKKSRILLVGCELVIEIMFA
jgi:hypothetical protein